MNKISKMIYCKFDLDELRIISYALEFLKNSQGGIDFIRPLYDENGNLTDDEIRNEITRIRGMISGFERLSSDK